MVLFLKVKVKVTWIYIARRQTSTALTHGSHSFKLKTEEFRSFWLSNAFMFFPTSNPLYKRTTISLTTYPEFTVTKRQGLSPCFGSCSFAGARGQC